ncbi:MAG: SpoIIE family protein phosphatase [Bacteroidota bacterium]|nr:SpoIIE family protein phosphatase [Bacteroidota bacterium]
MKLKITDPKIPGLFVLLGIIGAVCGIFSTSEAMESIGWISVIGSMLILTLVYFPILTFKLYGNKLENKHQIVNNIGIFSLSFIMIGVFLKLWHLPGAGPIIVVGCMVFYLNFVPAWYVANFKESDWYQRILSFVFCTTLGLMLAMHQFKVMHWPGGTLLTNLTFNIGLYILIPFGLITLLFRRKKNYFSFNITFIFGFMIAYILSGIASMKQANTRFASDNKTQLSVENNLRLYESKNKFLYEAFEKSGNKDSSFVKLKNKAQELKSLTNYCNDYIFKLKTDLVIQTDGLAESARDSISFDNIMQKTNYDFPTHMLIGDDANNPVDGPNTAKELKTKLLTFIKVLDSIVPEEYTLQLKQSNPFNFSDVKNRDEEIETWENANFNHEPLATVYTTLTGYQSNIRYMEMTVLNELFTKANANNKDNMAAQLAELAMKYETVKQEKKITMLQKDQEMNDVKIKAKDAEISNRENTISLFIFGAIIFGILMIFVVRSNIIRKQINKELAQQKDIITAQKNEVESQKHLVEEKQKEILDSITYAKRLQEAILPAQGAVDKQLPNNFILYTPKDLVAGDFYWMEVVTKDEKEITFIAAADSTGHGVPGAMVSVVCSNALNRAVLEFKLTNTGEILDKTRELVLETFSKSSSDVKDGMDISMLAVIRKNGEVSEVNWSGANNPLWYTCPAKENESPTELVEVKANKQPIGKTDNPTPFTTHVIPYVQGTSFYLFTDGYADQFGGPKGKKFKYKQLEELLLEISVEGMVKQKEILNSKFEEWKSGIEQVDDVCIIGLNL